MLFAMSIKLWVSIYNKIYFKTCDKITLTVAAAAMTENHTAQNIFFFFSILLDFSD